MLGRVPQRLPKQNLRGLTYQMPFLSPSNSVKAGKEDTLTLSLQHLIYLFLPKSVLREFQLKSAIRFGI